MHSYGRNSYGLHSYGRPGDPVPESSPKPILFLDDLTKLATDLGITVANTVEGVTKPVDTTQVCKHAYTHASGVRHGTVGKPSSRRF